MDNHSRIQRDAKRGWSQGRALKLFPTAERMLADRGIFHRHPTLKGMLRGATAEAVLTLHEHMPAVEVGDVLVPLHDHTGELRALRLWPIGSGRGPRRAMIGDWAHTGEGLVFASPAALDAMREGFKGRALVIAEGEPDTLSCAQAWPDVPVVGICGEKMWGEALGAWASGAAEVIIRTDDDTAGERYAAKIARSLRAGVPILRYRAAHKVRRGDGREEAADQNDLAMSGMLGQGDPPRSGCVLYEPPPAPAKQVELPAPKAAGSEERKGWEGDEERMWRLGRAALWWGARWERTLAEARQPGGTHGEGGWGSHALTDQRAAQGLRQTQLEEWARRASEGGTEEGRDLARRVAFALSALNPSAMEGELGAAAQAGARDAETRADRAAEVRNLARKAARQPMTEDEITRPVDSAPPPRTTKTKTKRKTSAPTTQAATMPTPTNDDREEGADMVGAQLKVVESPPSWERQVDARPWPRSPSETELARRLLDLYSPPGSPPPVAAEGCLWRYDASQGIWLEVTEDEAARVFARWDGAETDEGKSVSIGKRNSDGAYTQAVRLSSAQGDFFKGAPAGVMLRDRFLLVERGGVRFESPSPEHRARHRIAAAPSLEATEQRSHLLRSYLDSAHEGAEDGAACVRLMGEVAFVAMCGLGTRFKRSLMLQGPKGTGKSQFLDLLSALVPKSAQCHIPPQDLGDAYNKARLAGKVLNLVADIEAGEIIREGAIKEIAHGETVQARYPYGRPFDVTPIALHVFSCNEWPAAPGVSGAFWDRWLVLQFQRSFRGGEREVHDIGRRIATEELDALVSWAILCGEAMIARGGRYTIPAGMERAMNEWRKEGDSVAAWLDACTTPNELDSPSAWCPNTRAYRDYKEWCASRGFRNAVNILTFGKRIARSAVKVGHTKRGNTYAISLISDEAED